MVERHFRVSHSKLLLKVDGERSDPGYVHEPALGVELAHVIRVDFQ
jgi:hypothetical protein